MSLLACPGSYDIWWVRCQSTSETALCSQGAVNFYMTSNRFKKVSKFYSLTITSIACRLN